MKKFKRLFSGMLAIMILLFGLAMAVSGCKKEPPKPVFEIRLYDDNWKELEKSEYWGRNYNEYKRCEFEYDGERRGFNAIAYKDGEEFARYTYKNKKPDPLNIFDVYTQRTDDGYCGDAVNKGSWRERYSFDTFNMNVNTTFETPIGTIYATELPTRLEVWVYFDIK